MSEDHPEQSLKGQFRVEDGELILSDNENQEEKPGDSPDRPNSRKNRRKQTFERRNIKFVYQSYFVLYFRKVREDGLNEEAKAAQKAEMERRQRLVSKDKGDQVKFSNIDFLLNDSSSSPDFLKCSDANFQSEFQETSSFVKKEKKYESDADECNSLENGSTADSQRSSVEVAEKGAKHTVSDTCNSGGKQSPSNASCSGNDADQKRVVSSASASLFGSTWSDLHSFRMGHSQDDAILLGDSDDDQNVDSAIIEVSDGEDEPEVEVEAEICEIQDAENLADIDGKIIINTSRDQDEEPEIVLCPQMARVIKPHQVSGIRFLYDNVVESVKRFQTTDGFGCILAHSMGLGKTIQIIGFLDVLFRFCQAQRVLVIVPINTIQNWQAEFELWLPTDLSNCAANKKSKFFQRFSMSKSTVESKLPSDFSDHVNSSGDIDPSVPVVDSKETDTNLDGGMLWSSIFENDKSEPQSNGKDVSHESFYCEPNDSEFSFVNSSSCLRPFKLFVVRDTVKTMSQRHEIIQQWFEEGGVLLLGYEMFRLLLNQKRLNPPMYTTKVDVRIPKRRKKDICIDIEKEEKREKMWADFHTALLDPGPQLVICDEGHRIKNSEASISKALKAIKTHRRVVLTGYPLQNNLMEYWCMVDFVRPNYLGTKQEFTNMFQRPIENGQCIDSTPEDRKVMQGRAHVLHDLLSGFVQRRSHAVLKASLPPKTEIVLLIKLSSLQRTLYAAFMRSLGSSGPLGWAQVNTLKTYAMCCKIWNHPDILRRAMEEHKEAMDFDIEETTANNSNTSMSSTGRPPYHRSNSGTSTNNQSESQSWASGDSTSISSDLTSSQISSTPTNNNSTYFVSDSSIPLSFMTQNAVFPVSTTGSGTPSNTEQSNNNTNSTLNPGYFYTQNYAHQPSVGTYDWAGDQELWGEDFKAGNVEHSGKVLLFLDILKGSVLAGDKLLVFTQSLYTLDLLERILRHLPLPVLSNCDKLEIDPVKPEIPSKDVGKLKVTSNDPSNMIQENNEQKQEDKCYGTMYDCSETDHFQSTQPNEMIKKGEEQATMKDEAKEKMEIEEEEEETPKSLHYRLSTRRGCLDEPTVWTRNVHYFRLDGSTNASEREKLINNFNDPKNPAKLFLMSTRAGCLGVNLVGANRVVVFDASWNPCHDCQAVCRVYRYGQVKPCYIYRLVSDNTMEKKIYDRQVTKQGMSDRVVDELNPTQQFTRSQVELLMSFEDKDMATITDEDLEVCKDIVESDPILANVLKKHTKWITKRPFTHESLLIDRKDYRLTRVEKRMARQRYEQEKRLSLSYQQAHLFQLQQMQILQQQQQQLLAVGINPALVDTTRFYNSRTPNILSRSTINYRPTYTSGMAALDAMRQVDRQARLRMLQKDLDEARRRCGYSKSDSLNKVIESPDCKVTRIVANTDLFFPSTANSTTTQRKIPKGEVLEVIQTPKAKYLRISRTGDLFIVKTSGTRLTDSTSPTTTYSSLHSQALQKSSYPGSNSDPNVSRFNALNKSEHNVSNSSVTTYCNSQPFSYSSPSYNQSNTNIFQNSDSLSTYPSKESLFIQPNVSPKRTHSSKEPSFTCNPPNVKDSRQSYNMESSNYQNQMVNRGDNSTKEDRNNNNVSITYPNQSFSSQDPFQAHVQRVAHQAELSWPCLTCGRTVATGCTCRLNLSNMNNTPVRTTVSSSSSPTINDPIVQSSRFRPFTTNSTTHLESYQSEHVNNNKKNFPPTTNNYHNKNNSNPTNSYPSIYQNPARIMNNTNNDSNAINHAQHLNLSGHQANSLQSHVSMMQDYFSQLTNQHPQLSSGAAASSSLDLQRTAFGGNAVEQPSSHAVAAAMQQYLAHNSQNHMNATASNNNSAHHQTPQERNLSNLRTSFDPTVHYQQFQLAAAAKEQQRHQQLLEQQRQQRQQQSQDINFIGERNQQLHHTPAGPTAAPSSMFNHLHSQSFPNFHFPQF
ncbi:Helicase ARIP4 [Schistosoma japonicum]|nr:Helicase ARIP4 [Schistosoma japonicum]